MERSIIKFSVEHCQSCNYCAPDITSAPDIAAQIIKSDFYLNQLHDMKYPDLARKFLCSALVFENAGKPNVAGWNAVEAAWACDDAGMENSAIKSRQRAIKLFEKVKTNNQAFSEGVGADEAIMADLLRRSGNFEKVESVCQSGLEKRPDEIIEKMLLFQKELARKKDVKCHTIAEVPEYQQISNGKDSRNKKGLGVVWASARQVVANILSSLMASIRHPKA